MKHGVNPRILPRQLIEVLTRYEFKRARSNRGDGVVHLRQESFGMTAQVAWDRETEYLPPPVESNAESAQHAFRHDKRCGKAISFPNDIASRGEPSLPRHQPVKLARVLRGEIQGKRNGQSWRDSFARHLFSSRRTVGYLQVCANHNFRTKS